MPFHKSPPWHLAIRVALFASIVYFLTASGTIFGSDGARRLQVARNLLERGRVDIQTNAPAPVGRNGRQYAQYALGHSIAMMPGLLLGKALAPLVPLSEEPLEELFASLVNLVAVSLTAGLLVLFAAELGYPPRSGVQSACLFSFATMAWQQSKDSFEHPQVGLYFTLLFFALHRFSKNRRRCELVLASLALGLALLTRYTSVLAYPSVSVFLAILARQTAPGKRFLSWARWVTCFFLCQIPFVAFNLWFNAVRFGSAFETGQQQLFGNIFSNGNLLAGLWGLTFRWEYGLIPFNPILILWPIGIFLLSWKQKALSGAAAILAVCFLLFYGSTTYVLWTGGWAWGPRFWMDILPLLVLTSLPALAGIRQGRAGPRWAPAVLRLLVVLSVCIQVQSILVNYNRGFTKRALRVQGHSFQARGFRESSLFLQAENIGEMTRSYLQGRFPSCRQRAQVFTSLASLDQSISFSSYQFWWVYALHCGAPPLSIFLYLLWTGLALFLLARRIQNSLREQEISAAP